MPRGEAFMSWLNEKLTKTTIAGYRKMSVMLPKHRVMVDRVSIEYLMYLGPLYTDIDFGDLATMLNHCHGTEYTEEDLKASYKHKLRNESVTPYEKERQEKLIMLPLKLDYYVKAFLGAETDRDYNEPIAKLARYRREYDHAMTELAQPFLSNAPHRCDHPPDLNRIFEVQEKIRKEKCDAEGIDHDGLTVRPRHRWADTTGNMLEAAITFVAWDGRNALSGKKTHVDSVTE
ncbi:MAG: hypothetical protein Q9168_006453 [Polycauliona sp. 1 TL-2023]